MTLPLAKMKFKTKQNTEMASIGVTDLQLYGGDEGREVVIRL